MCYIPKKKYYFALWRMYEEHITFFSCYDCVGVCWLCTKPSDTFSCGLDEHTEIGESKPVDENFVEEVDIDRDENYWERDIRREAGGSGSPDDCPDHSEFEYIRRKLRELTGNKQEKEKFPPEQVNPPYKPIDKNLSIVR